MDEPVLEKRLNVDSVTRRKREGKLRPRWNDGTLVNARADELEWIRESVRHHIKSHGERLRQILLEQTE